MARVIVSLSSIEESGDVVTTTWIVPEETLDNLRNYFLETIGKPVASSIAPDGMATARKFGAGANFIVTKTDI